MLFIVLIAVGLFAALTYAVSSSSRNSGANASKESDGVVASNVLDYAASLRMTVQRLRLAGCADDEISFETPLHWYNYANPKAPSSKKCNVFDKAGGSMAYLSPNTLFSSYIKNGGINTSANTEHFIGNTDIPQIGRNCTASDCSDLYLFIIIDGSAADAICKAINQRLQMTSLLPFPDVGSEGLQGWPPFVGTYTNPNSTVSAIYNNQYSFCYKDSYNPAYRNFYSVLLAR